jgi:anti-anti-sigma factor
MQPTDQDPQSTFAVSTRAASPAVVVLEVTGPVDLDAEADLNRSISAAMDLRPEVLIVDISRIELLTSAGMAVLLGSHNRAQGETTFRVVATGKTSLRPLQVLGLTDVMAIYATLDDALAA